MHTLKKNIIFFDKFSKVYDNIIFKIWFGKVFKKILKETPIKNNSIILDVGCGTGNFLKLLSKNKTLELHGIDISPKMLKIAKNKLKKNVKLKLIPVEEMEYENQFDYVFSTESFHHYSNQEQAMKKFNLALKENGKLIVADLNFGKFLNKIFNKIEPGNQKMNSNEDFLILFKKQGFKEIVQKKAGLFVTVTIGKKIK